MFKTLSRMVVFAILSGWGISGAAGEVLKPDFSKQELDGKDQQGGIIRAKILGESKSAEFIGEKEDSAVRLLNSGLSYPVGNLINLDSGTISFWIKPQSWEPKNWQPGGNTVIPLFRVTGCGPWLDLYIVNNSSKGLIRFCSWSETRAEIRADTGLDGKLLRQNEWTHVTATWDAQGIALYLNGVRTVTASYGLGSNRVAGKECLLSLLPPTLGKDVYKLDTLLKGLVVRDDTLSEGAVKAYYETMTSDLSKFSQPACVQVPFCSSAPTIDGKFDAGEWEDASRIPLMKLNGSLQLDSTLPAWALLKHDGAQLYIGYYVENVQKLEAPVPANAFSEGIFGGDVVEFYCRRPQDGINAYYQFGLAPNNAYAVRLPDGSFKEVEFTHQTSVGDGCWTAEMAIPLRAIGMASAAIPLTLAANFGVHRTGVDRLSSKDRWIAWSAPRTEAYFRNMGTIELMPDTQSCRINSLGDLRYGGVDFQFSGKPEKDLRVELTVSDSQGTPKVSRKFESGRAELKDSLTWIGIGLLSVKATDKASGRTVFGYDSPITVSEPVIITPVCHSDRRMFELEIDITGLKEKAAKAMADGRVKLKATLSAVADGKIYGKCEAAVKEAIFKTPLAFEEMPVGSYTIAVAIEVDGQQFVKTLPFERPDPQFLIDRKGLDAYVPAPWTALRKEGDTIQTRFHRFRFGESPFPAQSYSQDTLVQSGAVLVVGNGNTQESFKPEEAHDVEVSPERIVSEGSMTADGLKVKLRWRREINYDGMIRYDLKLQPASPRVKLDKLSLALRVPTAAATYAITPTDRRRSYRPEWRQSAAVEIAAFPTAWLTSDKVGFCLFTDNDANWVYPDGNDPIAMIKEADGAQLVANLIGAPVELTSEVSYVLAVMATPGKTPRDDFRKLHAKEHPLKVDQGGRFIRIRGWNSDRKTFWFPRWHMLTRFFNPDAARKSISEYARQGVECIPYSMGTAMPDNNPIFDYYGTVWRRSANGKPLPKCDYMKDEDGAMFYGGVPVCPNSTGFADYLCFYTDKLLKEYDLHGLYLDWGGENHTDTPYKATILKDTLRPGRAVRSFNTFGLRDMYERLSKIIHAANPDHVLWIHCWDRYHPAITSFADIIFPGEEFMHVIRQDLRAYATSTPLESWQSVYSPVVQGAAVQFLNQYRFYQEPIYSSSYSNAEKRVFARDLLTMVLLHDIDMSDYFMAEVHQVMDQLRIWEAEFEPYWRQKEITTDNDSIKLSYYHWKDRSDILVVVGNLKNTPQAARITFAESMPAATQAVDALSGESFDLSSQPVPLGDYSCRILKCKKP